MLAIARSRGNVFSKLDSLNAKTSSGTISISFFEHVVFAKFPGSKLPACFPGNKPRFCSVNFQSSCYPCNPFPSRKAVENVGIPGLEPGL